MAKGLGLKVWDSVPGFVRLEANHKEHEAVRLEV